MILLINNHSNYLKSLENMLKRQKVNFILKNQESLIDDVEKRKIKGVILSGGGPELTRKIKLNKIRADIASILNFDVPVLGICEGHQIIGEIFEGEVSDLKKPIYKKIKVKLVKKSPIFKNLPEEIEVQQSHARYVRKAPEEFEIAASSSKTKIESLFHKEKPIFSTQFHPEKSGENGEKIIKNFLEIC